MVAFSFCKSFQFSVVSYQFETVRQDDIVSTLMDAVSRSEIGAASQAIADGADVNELSAGMTPLLIAVFRGDIDMVRLLLEKGADPNLRGNPMDASSCPLWHAEDDFGLIDIAKVLKSYGAAK